MSIVEKIRSLKPRNPSQNPTRNSLDGNYRILEDSPNKQTVEFIESVRGRASADLRDLQVRINSAGLEEIPPHTMTFIKNALENRHLSKAIQKSQSQSGKREYKNVNFPYARTEIEKDFDSSFGVYLDEEGLTAAKAIAGSIAQTLITLPDHPDKSTDIRAKNHTLADQIEQLDKIVSVSPLP